MDLILLLQNCVCSIFMVKIQCNYGWCPVCFRLSFILQQSSIQPFPKVPKIGYKFHCVHEKQHFNCWMGCCLAIMLSFLFYKTPFSFFIFRLRHRILSKLFLMIIAWGLLLCNINFLKRIHLLQDVLNLSSRVFFSEENIFSDHLICEHV